ncbi:MAG: 4-(cytidine 5'-diphospho)-2-C-methyl-D-erythritol kinase [Prevotellaceae bacterium]|jgi:4-diphosphocytidyl-2-C-methyl-D-erythritol kinase|nr:4-(cytidine 5'-diphospho)-2-C-methyl-D-erythritol kinase [Prevotellaceae bacterium]
MLCFPHAKINLGLYVTDKRSDGFHTIQTLFYPIPYHDILEIVPSNKSTIYLSGKTIEGPTDNNLCWKAYRLLQNDCALPPVAIYLHKLIPSGAGLGGGSSNATHTLLSLNRLFELNLPTGQLLAYAAQLGSDCAFFTQAQPMLAEGRGELLRPVEISLAGYYLLLVFPNVHISTAEAYAGISPKTPQHVLEKTISLPIKEWRHQLSNDFEKHIFKQYPLLGNIKASLYNKGAVYAAMSGSGSTIFGLFTDKFLCNETAASFSFSTYIAKLK